MVGPYNAVGGGAVEREAPTPATDATVATAKVTIRLIILFLWTLEKRRFLVGDYWLLLLSGCCRGQ